MDNTTKNKISVLNEKFSRFDERKALEHLLLNFDFEKVHRTMALLRWGWGHHLNIPTVSDMIASVREKYDVLEADPSLYSIYSGGFKLSRTSDDGEPLLRLQFILEEWSECVG